MLYEIHMLKNYPSTNLNRDDSGSPKTCMFGGVARGRISSQCLKRSWRTSPIFRELVGEKNLGIRTRELPEMVANILRSHSVDEKDIQKCLPIITGIANKDGTENKKGNRTAQIVFYSPEDVQVIAGIVENFICSGEKKKFTGKDLQNAVKDAGVRPITLDIALFGRMVTSDAFRDVEASMQVAHGISTNKIVMESDYFTAMDDLLTGDIMESKGSSMIGDIDYNSACYYLYASLDADALAENLSFGDAPEELVRKAVPALIQTMAVTNPSGKQNSFAGHVLPCAVLVECKDQKIPVSYVNAYSEPAIADASKGLVENSIEKLVEECNMITRNFAVPVKKRLWFCVDKYNIEGPENTVVCQNFGQLVDEVAKTLK